ncbi:MAG: U32 family peptidase [Eubacterium sp.]|nr:U32 family peptidase [Eubacterium sp.]
MSKPIVKKPELLIPASSPEVFKTALYYGADAIYIGGESFGLRAGSKNFSHDEMKAAVDMAHEKGVKVYVTANIFAHNDDLEAAEEYFATMVDIKPDALLVSDPGLFMAARKACPEVPIHISTQANNTNYGTFNFWYEHGVRRLVCARELSLAEIKKIRANIPEDCEIEAFVHGAMCISYSGRCLLSAYMTGREANHGECAHPCRWKYAVVEQTRPGQYMDVDETDRGTYIFNSSDLAMIGHIDDMVDAGIDSFKIEGRMKTALYVAVMARAYRNAIDLYFEDPDEYRRQIPRFEREIRSCTYREYCTGFFYGKPGTESQIYGANTYQKGYTYLGNVEEITSEGYIKTSQYNKFSVGDAIEIVHPDGTDEKRTIGRIFDMDGTSVESAPHPRQEVYIDLGDNEASVGMVLRREE